MESLIVPASGRYSATKLHSICETGCGTVISASKPCPDRLKRRGKLLFFSRPVSSPLLSLLSSCSIFFNQATTAAASTDPDAAAGNASQQSQKEDGEIDEDEDGDAL